MAQEKTTNQGVAPVQGQAVVSAQSSGFISKMIELWKQIIFHPDEFFENLPELNTMLTFIGFNYLIISVTSLINTWIIMDRIYAVLGENLPFGTVFGEFLKWFFISGAILFVALFILAGVTYLLTKAFGNKYQNFYSVFDIIFAPFAMGFLAPLTIIFVSMAGSLSFATNVSASALQVGTLAAIASIFSIYLSYVVIAGLKKTCEISALKAAASWIFSIFVVAVIVWIIFRPDNIIKSLFYYQEDNYGQDGICNVDATYDPDCDDYDYY